MKTFLFVVLTLLSTQVFAECHHGKTGKLVGSKMTDAEGIIEDGFSNGLTYNICHDGVTIQGWYKKQCGAQVRDEHVTLICMIDDDDGLVRIDTLTLSMLSDKRVWFSRITAGPGVFEGTMRLTGNILK